MRPDKFTIKSQEAIQKAQDLAQNKGNQQVDVEHLLTVLIEEGIIPAELRSEIATAETTATPPNRGMGVLCTFLSVGMSTAPIFPAILMESGVKRWTEPRATRKRRI